MSDDGDQGSGCLLFIWIGICLMNGFSWGIFAGGLILLFGILSMKDLDSGGDGIDLIWVILTALFVGWLLS